MGTLYYDDMADVLRAAGLSVVEYDGWERRARSSGGFASAPLGIQWHHTASQTSPANDVAWMADNSDDAPIGNGLIARDGVVWLIAAGAANTAGKGGPVTMSRGVVPLDSGNSTTWAWEVANNGVGEPWPQIQVDAYFAASNAANKRFGNKPTDVFTHAVGTGNGWTDRKVDPATAAAVQGPWKPRSVSGSGTWSLDDIRAECNRRANILPPPTPSPIPLEDAMYIWRHSRYADQFAIGAGALHINATVSKRLSADGVPMIVEDDDRMLDFVCQASGFPRSAVDPL